MKSGTVMPPLVDTHAHMEILPDVEDAVARAKSAGVEAIVAVGSNPESNLKVLGLSRHYAGYLLPAFGLHPWDLPDCAQGGLSFLKARVDECIALGEVGLDHWIKADRKLQRTTFEEVLSLAYAAGKPVLIHSRGAWAEALEAVEASGVKKAIFHWFSGPADVLRKVVDRGFLISATPALAYNRAHREAVRLAPLENIVIETDCPVKYGGAPSEPADLLKSLKALAELKALREQVVAERTTENAVRLFQIELKD
ncbi:MAG: TatD family hydrolase [Candidatus Bathyarchaeia archaeon]